VEWLSDGLVLYLYLTKYSSSKYTIEGLKHALIRFRIYVRTNRTIFAFSIEIYFPKILRRHVSFIGFGLVAGREQLLLLPEQNLSSLSIS